MSLEDQLNELIKRHEQLVADLRAFSTALERSVKQSSRIPLEHIETQMRDVWRIHTPLTTPSREADLVRMREVFALLACTEFGYNHGEVADYLKQERSTVSYTVARGRAWLQDKDFVERLWKLKQRIIESYGRSTSTGTFEAGGPS